MPDTGPRTHVFIIDGTLSRLDPGEETNAGILFKLLRERPSTRQTVGYHAGVQGKGLRGWIRVASGQGLNDAIRIGYAVISARYRPGDRIMLFGYSRGAYAARSLGGLIDRVGLLRSDDASASHVRRAFRLYERLPDDGRDPAVLRAFQKAHCHDGAAIEMIGVWDTVKALGLPYPILTRIAPMATEFHSLDLGPHIRNGYHALAIDEDRTAYRPLLWTRAPGWTGGLEQRWFPGAHPDVGGQIGSYLKARPLSNVALHWMLGKAEERGLKLPDGWRERYPADPTAPMCGARRGIGMFFLLRQDRRIGAAHGEALHESVRQRIRADPGYAPTARGAGIG